MMDILEKAIKKLKEANCSFDGNYTYFLPSPNEGKRLMIRGPYGPGEAAKIATDILQGKAKIEDYECVEEIDLWG